MLRNVFLWTMTTLGLLAGEMADAQQIQTTGREEVVRYVGPWKADCMGVGPMTCMQVASQLEGPYTFHYDGIRDFDYREGSTYKLRIAIEKLDYGAPVADAPMTRWTCLEVLETLPLKPSKPLEGTEFVLTELPEPGGLLRPVAGRVSISFQEGKISGSAGCNRYFGTLQKGDGNAISFGPLGTTRKLCPPPEMETETTFLERMKETASFVHAGDRLVFYSAKGAKLLVFK